MLGEICALPLGSDEEEMIKPFFSPFLMNACSLIAQPVITASSCVPTNVNPTVGLAVELRAFCREPAEHSFSRSRAGFHQSC